MQVAAMATLECHCGNVSLKLPNPVPKARCGCCCVDCLQRAYIGSKGMLRSALKNLLEPVDLIYVDSQIMRPDAATKSRLSLFRLNDANAPNIGLRTNCCGAVLCTQHQGVHVPHTMATFANLGPSLKCEVEDVPASRVQLFTKDWPADRVQSLARADRLPQIADPAASNGSPQLTELFAAFQTEASPKPLGSISYAELCEGMEISVDSSFFEESRFYRP